MRLPQAVILVLAACGASKPAAPPPPVSNTAEPTEVAPPTPRATCTTISGTMIDAVRKEPMIGATIVLVGGAAPNEEVVITDEHGVWQVGANGRTTLVVYYEDKTEEISIDPATCDLGTLYPSMSSP
jgi:hypothetical protein